MSENVAVHSNKHLEYLLEKTAMDSEEVEDDRLESPALDTSNTTSEQFDILKLGQGNAEDSETHYGRERKPSLRSVNQVDNEGYSDKIGNKGAVDQNYEQEGEHNGHPESGHEDSRLEDLKKQFKKLQEDYSKFQNAVLTDSLDVDSEETENSYNAFLDASNDQNRQENASTSFQGYASQNEYSVNSEALLLMHDDDNALNDSDSESGYGKQGGQKPTEHNGSLPDMEAKPRPKFKYKESPPVFVTKNKTNLGRKSQGSYSQKFKTERQIVNNRQKKREKNGTDDRFDENSGLIQQVHNVHVDNMSVGFEGLQNQMVQPWPQSNSQMSGQPLQLPMQDLRHLRESLEISRLEDMIREEENNLKNHVLDLSPKDTSREIYGYPETYQNIETSFPPEIEQQKNMRTLLPSVKRQFIGNSYQVNRGDDPQKFSSYADKHIHNFDRIKETASESPSSYAAQHLEKKNPTVSYKRYSLKDYKALTKEVKLQKSLGPDKFSEEYIEKVKI